LRPLVRVCLEHGDDGVTVLTELERWWKSDVNRLEGSKPDTISALKDKENAPLQEAEHAARDREPGNGSSQEIVVDQIARTISERRYASL
jgi:hypothetical protein